MKKSLILFIVIIFMVTGCTTKKAEVSTVLGDYTPYYIFPEKLNGHIEKIIEKSYWTVPDGDTIKKGNPITIKDRDSLSWTNDFEATFDNGGNLLSCNLIDENDKVIQSWDLTYENNKLISATRTRDDTIRILRKYKYNEIDNSPEISLFREPVDTLISSCNIKTNDKDTVSYYWFDYEGNLASTWVYLYNTNGQFRRLDSYTGEDTYDGAIDVIYDDNGQMSVLTFYDKDNNVTEVNYITNETDEKGNWIKSVIKDDKGRTFITERVYKYFD
jgi:hypothetical protein